MILNTEEAMHKVVRRQNAGATPPPLRATRIAESEVVEIDEPSCMLRGGRTCEIIVRQISAGVRS